MSGPTGAKAFIFGLDGVCFEVLEPLLRDGAVPHLARLIEEGGRGPMRTVFPPVTAPAWLALATGLNPGKTGVFDYINRVAPHGTELQPVSSRDYQGRAVWDLLGAQGLRVGIFNYPTLSPPPAVNGFAVSGMGGRRGRMCHPQSLEEELHRLTGGYECFLNLRNPAYGKRIELFFADIERILDKQARALRHLMTTREWDFFFGVLSVTDWMQHVLWRHLDPSHPQHDPAEAAPVRARYDGVWRKIDALVGEVLALLPAGADFLIVSDHGAGGLDSVFYPNAWLEQQGWVARRRSWKALLARWIGLFAGGSDQKYAHRLGQLLRDRVLRLPNTVDLIDFDRSLAYSPEHNTMFGCINLTEAGRERPGFLEELEAGLRRLPGVHAGIDRVETHRPADLYVGPCAGQAPDILFVVNDYRATVEIDFATSCFRSRPSLALRTGGHREDGVLIARGPAFRPGAHGRVSILQVAPTVLALFGAEIPSAVDGCVLTEWLAPEAAARMEIRYGAGSGVAEQEAARPEEMQEMKDMLKSLGYL